MTFDQPKSKKICVAGMHRSGTSLVSMWLNGCGINFADKSQLFGPGVFNKKGHFEDKRIVNLHEIPILEQCPQSKGWIVEKDLEFLFTLKDEKLAASVLMSYESLGNLWGFKDPRMCLFLKSWKKLVPDLKVVFVWRPVGEVVFSLLNRSRNVKSETTKIGFLNALQSWKVYNKKILEFYEIYPEDVILFRLEDILKNDQEVIKLVNSKFNKSLEYVSMNSFYESELLTTNRNSFLNVIPEIKRITNKLQLHSVKFFNTLQRPKNRF